MAGKPNNGENFPFLRPAWRRATVISLCAVLAIWDLSNGQFVWAAIFGAMGAYAFYIFFITWKDDDKI